jgi:hypothetical protein
MDRQTSESEQAAIRQAIMDYYHEGHVQSDPALYEQILHPDWRFALVIDGQLKLVARDEYLSWYNPQDADPGLNWETEFYSVDVTGSLASVKLRLECQTVRYIDYFHLVKVDGRWWIMHKMSHPVHKDP